jgi:hypothetical protein
MELIGGSNAYTNNNQFCGNERNNGMDATGDSSLGWDRLQREVNCDLRTVLLLLLLCQVLDRSDSFKHRISIRSLEATFNGP